MTHHHKHKLKIYRWINGILETTEHFFESLEDALLLAKATDGHSFKLYDHNDDLVHSGMTAAGHAYA
jgi:hypothetical protein